MQRRTILGIELDRSLRVLIQSVPVVFLLLLTIILPLSSRAQDDVDYEEISIFLTVQRVGSIEIPAVISNDKVYLPITDVFDFLKIRNQVSSGYDSISGFYINTRNLFSVNFPQKKIFVDGKSYELPESALIKTETSLYLLADYFGKVFGLNCSFNYRALAVLMDTKLELPIIREMRLEQMRTNIGKLRGESQADSTLGRTYPMFHLGMADWSLISNQVVNGRTDTRFNLALGGIVLGGETNVSLLFNSHQAFNEKQQQYLWRFANNDFKYVKQMMAGKIVSQATSSIYAPVVGVQFTNSPTTFRRSFGYYTLSDNTEPNWTVELYVNNVLVDYVKADASGFYTFQVPLVYGSSAVMLKFYGPWGEERTKEQNISIPFNFLPPGEMQYTVSGGIVEDSLSSRYSRASMNYGLASRVTVGGGMEYLSSVTSGPLMPYLSSSVRLASSLLLSGEYTYGVRKKGIITYRFPSNVQLELYYTTYDKGQKAINYNYREERKAVLAVPLRTKNFSAFSRLTLNQIILPESRYTTAEMLLSGAIYGVSTNFTTYAMFVDPKNPYAYSNLSFSFRLPAAFVLIPQAQYEYRSQKLISLKCGIEKHVFKQGFFNVSYEQNFKSNIRNIEFGFRYDFSFVQAAFTARRINKNTLLTQSGKGSLMYDRGTSYLHAGNRTSVGRGGVVILPFLDLNCNGIKDEGEPRAAGLNVHLSGGRIEPDLNDTLIRVFDLEPYTSYFIEFDRNSFDNIAWQLKFKSLRVNIDPNKFRRIDVPISVFGEASGTVYRKSGNFRKGLGRVIVCFYDKAGKIVGRTLSESDGYFSFLGLPPGNYIAKVDTSQLRKISMVSAPDSFEFEINVNPDGDVRDDLEFVLSSLITSQNEPAVQQEPVKTNPVQVVIAPVSESQAAVSGKKTDKDTIVKQSGIKTESISAEATDTKKEVKPEQVVQKTEIKPNEIITEKKEIKPEPVVPVVKATESQAEASSSERSDIDKLIPSVNLTEKKEDSKLQGVRNKKPLPGTYGIQIGAFNNYENAMKSRVRLIDALAKDVFLYEEDGFFKVMITGFNDLKAAKEFLPTVKGRGFVEAFIIRIR